MEATTETVNTVIGIFDENGFMTMLAIQGFLLPGGFIIGAYFLIRHAINKLADPLRRLADHMDEVEK